MPKTKDFKKLEHATIKEYGKSRGEKVAYATAHKYGIKIDKR